MECEACKIAVRTLDNFLKENKTEKEVNSTVYEICLRLSGQQLVQMVRIISSLSTAPDIKG